ncbi:hypothetical protein L2E82_47399 [Cichorium intybus]|uniref:Uncharacterized protein n=1 Tax=Cichorium intybus TaxID=13427 RepID=A0ACB8YVY6_CICIN|nr:hypothetical protein L2E82_47399 [Cichorium intybus]
MIYMFLTFCECDVIHNLFLEKKKKRWLFFLDWFPLKSSCNNSDQNFYESEDDEDDEDGISDTIFGNDDDDNNSSKDDVSLCEEDGDDDVMESNFEEGGKPDNLPAKDVSGQASGENVGTHGNMDGQYREEQQVDDFIPALNDQGILSSDPVINISTTQELGVEYQLERNDVEQNNGVIGPIENEAQIGIENSHEAQREPTEPFVFSAASGPNLKFNIGTGLGEKRRRPSSPIHIAPNKRPHSSVPSPTQSPSIDLNRNLSQSEPLGNDMEENSLNDQISELDRTVEVGRMVGFQMDGSNEMLAAILGGNGEQLVIQ